MALILPFLFFHIKLVHQINGEMIKGASFAIEYIGDMKSDAKYLSYSQSDGFVDLSTNAYTGSQVWFIEQTFKYDNNLHPSTAFLLKTYPMHESVKEIQQTGLVPYYGSLQRWFRTNSNDGYEAVVKPLRDNVHHIYEDKWSIEYHPTDHNVFAIGTVDDTVHNRRYMICSGSGWEDRCKLKKLNGIEFDQRFKFRIRILSELQPPTARPTKQPTPLATEPNYDPVTFSWKTFCFNYNYPKFSSHNAQHAFGLSVRQFPRELVLITILKNCIPTMPDGYVIAVEPFGMNYKDPRWHVLEWDLTNGYANAVLWKPYGTIDDICDPRNKMVDHFKNQDEHRHFKLWEIQKWTFNWESNKTIYTIQIKSPDRQIHGTLGCVSQLLEESSGDQIFKSCRLYENGGVGHGIVENSITNVRFDGWWVGGYRYYYGTYETIVREIKGGGIVIKAH